MTFLELKNAVKTNHGGRTDKDLLITSALNMAQARLVKSHKFESLKNVKTFTIFAEATSVPLGSDVELVSNIVWKTDGSTTSYSLFYKTKTEVLEECPTPSLETPTDPVLCYKEQGSLFFSAPVASNGKLVVSYYPKPVPFTSDDQEPQVSGSDEVLIAWATYYVYASLNMPESAGIWLQDANGAAETLIRNDVKDGGLTRLKGRSLNQDLEDSGSRIDQDSIYKPFVRRI